jgi:hypothetical protein
MTLLILLLAPLLVSPRPAALAAPNTPIDTKPPGEITGETTDETTGEPTDEQAIAAWERLTAEERSELTQWFAAEVGYLDTFQAGLIKWRLARQEVDPGTWPRAERAPLFDPAIHAPAQPIARTWLAPDDRRVRALEKKVFKGRPERALDSAFRYDYASGQLLRLGDPEDPERVFKNGLAGLPPKLGLAEALVEMDLDGGELRAACAAFAHAYTDRSGNAYPGVTLYDAWGSGMEMEMPDVDCLGIVHELLADWKTWKAPVRKQKSLYRAIGEIYADVRRHRQLRGALARSYLQAEPALAGGHGPALTNYHALWESVSSLPSDLEKALPPADEWQEYLTAWARRCLREEALFRKGEARAAALLADQRRVRATLLRVMDEFGAFAPEAAAPPPPPPPPPPTDK